MRQFYLGADGKPCIWPIPGDCTWNGERYESGFCLSISACEEFIDEARIFAGQLAAYHPVSVETGGGCADIKLLKSGDSNLGSEGYTLDVDGTGVRLQANTGRGMLYGLQTLLSLITNSPDPSIHGVNMVDRPLKSFRGVRLTMPERENISWFKGLVDFLLKYKFNTLILGLNTAAEDFPDENETRELLRFIRSRHMDIIPELPAPVESNRIEEVIRLFEPAMVYIDLDGLQNSGPHGSSGEKPGVSAVADCVCRLNELLVERGIGMAVSSGKLFDKTGSRKICRNEVTGTNEIIPSSWEAIFGIPKNILIFDRTHGGLEADSGSQDYFRDHGFDTVFADCSGPLKDWDKRIRCSNVQGAFVYVDSRVSDAAMGEGENKLVAMLKLACILWWQDYCPSQDQAGYLLSQYLERIVAQLYPMERNRLNDTTYPSRETRTFKTLDMRKFYNAPLVRSYWRADDYYMMYLKDARNLPNTVPFNLFQGVLDFKTQAAFCLLGNWWNNGLYDIPVGLKLGSLAFLHTYIFGKQAYIKGLDTLNGAVIGYYRVHYADGSEERANIVYGRTIAFWKNYHGTNEGAYWSDPVLTGISEHGLGYTVYSQEWINPKLDIEVTRIDMIPSDDYDGAIAVLGITAVI